VNQSFDLICFSHLRWSFVFQRPQHLLSRYARERRVYYVEEPVFGEGLHHLEVATSIEGVQVIVPHLNPATHHPDAVQSELLREFMAAEGIERYVLWYYTPMALPIARDWQPLGIVYDCMDQLAAFKNAPPELLERERELFTKADIVFTGGYSLYEEKKARHGNVHPFPSSVDVQHFAQARAPQDDPEDQKSLRHPRLGFYGVIDERMDLNLLAGAAAARPDWSFVLLGPILKVDSESLPRAGNIHYLGSKQYSELPRYASGWDVAILPFARNESTEFISPTKTPEYLAAGLPVVSTSIRDVKNPYEGLGLVRIADSVPDFVAACEAAFGDPVTSAARRAQADAFLAKLSWDKTWSQMALLVERALQRPLETSSRTAALSAVERTTQADGLAAGE
jgi:glycosyltransferase involved in cell wall biosynthesis